MFEPTENSIFKPKDNLTVSQCAERYRVVKTGPAQGQWTNRLTPYLVDVMDTWGLPHVRKCFLCFAPQTGKTQAAFNTLLYAVINDPGPAMYIMPDEKTGRRIIKRQLMPMFRHSPHVRDLLSPAAHDQSIDHIKFINGMDLILGWAGSPASMASESVRYLYLDEPGKYPQFSGREADSFTLPEMRTNAFPYTKKIMYFSTPVEEGNPFTEAIESEADEKRVLHVKCPRCGFYQQMIEAGLKWPENKSIKSIMHSRSARYECQSCGALWSDLDRDRAVSECKWIAEKEKDRPISVAWHLPAWYSPFISLSEVVKYKIMADKDPVKLFAYFTQYKAEPFKEVIEKQTENEILAHRCELSQGEVHDSVMAITAGIDPQQKGFWYVVRAWAEDYTSWLLDYGRLSDWDDVFGLVFGSEYKTRSGKVYKIWRAAIDTGGGVSQNSPISRTEEIYQWLRLNSRGVVFGVKGSSRPQVARVRATVLDRLPSGKWLPGGLELRHLDVNAFKDVLQWRLSRAADESQQFFLHKSTGSDYSKQLLSEEKRRNKQGKTEWVQVGKDNHLFDCEIYASACVDDQWTPSLSMICNVLKQQEKERIKRSERPKKHSFQRRNERRGRW